MGFKSVSDYYLFESQKLADEVPGGVILKADLCNETMIDRPAPGGIIGPLSKNATVYGVEYDKNLINMAEKTLDGYKFDRSNINLSHGDIRRLNFTDSFFDLILDLSTIDHVRPQEVGEVIREYARVLKRGGKALIISWIDLSFSPEEMAPWVHTNQYYHSEPMIEGLLAENGLELIEKKIVVVQDRKPLIKFLARRT